MKLTPQRAIQLRRLRDTLAWWISTSEFSRQLPIGYKGSKDKPVAQPATPSQFIPKKTFYTVCSVELLTACLQCNQIQFVFTVLSPKCWQIKPKLLSELETSFGLICSFNFKSCLSRRKPCLYVVQFILNILPVKCIEMSALLF